jgi:hypothetical protein
MSSTPRLENVRIYFLIFIKAKVYGYGRISRHLQAAVPGSDKAQLPME